MGEKQNNPGGESTAVILTRIDITTKNTAKDVENLKLLTSTRLNDHAGRIRTLELNGAIHKGEEKGRNWSIKRIATLLGIAIAVITFIGMIIAITPQ